MKFSIKGHTLIISLKCIFEFRNNFRANNFLEIIYKLLFKSIIKMLAIHNSLNKAFVIFIQKILFLLKTTENSFNNLVLYFTALHNKSI